MSSSHPRLRVNLQTLRTNYLNLQGRLSAAACGAVVKANAYGLGIGPVAKALYGAGCREFFVASLEEALQLRDLLPPSGRILVLQGCEAGDEAEFARAQLIPVLISLPMAERFLAKTAQFAMGPGCAIKLNTGMNRLGLDLDEFAHLLKRSDLLNTAGFNLLISHLACADEPGHALNEYQLRGFRSALQAARPLFPRLRASLANSAGIFLGPNYHFDLARPGAALYGINPGFPQNPMAKVASLGLQIMQIRRVRAGEAVGYGASYRTATEQMLAVVSGGYADGLMRAFSNQIHGYWGERRVPLVGRVSMDSMVFDISSLPVPPQVGDCIELLGPNGSADELASAAQTISYEIYTRLGDRCLREYVGECADTPCEGACLEPV